MNKAFFLDRDGTVNVDYNFVHTPGEWTWCTGALESISWMKEQGYKVIVVTNQSGISRGLYTEEHVTKLHNWVDRELAGHGLAVDDWYIAPWHPDYSEKPYRYAPEDRKPGTGMFLKAAEKHRIDFSRSCMAGDKVSDLKPAVELGMQPFFIRSRHEPDQDKAWLKEHGIGIYDNIGEAVATL